MSDTYIDIYIIYLDIFIIINFFMDYIILWATSKLTGLTVSQWRLLGGTAAGAAYSLTVLFPLGGMLPVFFVKIIFSILMVLITFYPVSTRTLLKACVIFYLSAFIMGGTVIGVVYLVGDKMVLPVLDGSIYFSYNNISYTWLLVAAGAAVFLVRYGAGWIKQNFLHYMLRLPVIIAFAGKTLDFKALVDTGNSLRDPFFQRPVIIVEYDALRSVLPSEIIKEYSSLKEPDIEFLVASLKDTSWATRLCLLPYRSLGNNRGMLLGLRPDEVTVVMNKRMLKIKDVIIGLYKEQLSIDGNYRALLHPDLLQFSMGL